VCLAVFVGSAVPLPVRPWARHPGEFNLAVLGEGPGRDEVRRRLQRPFIYEVGSYEGCACGFARPYDDEELPQWEQSLRLLTAWLVAAVESGPVVALICWLGDEGKKPRRRTVRANEIAGFDFRSANREPMRLTVHV
jgi:hypothetical protein